jgi:alkanesulfonate monooxygenase SsuD/methylene tetrahydromethanopterin reductase-like flavin-dependent oxidoreductase (luciferase family)
VFGAISDDPTEAQDVLARILVMYLSVMGDVYPRLARTQGYGEELRMILEANMSPTDGIVPEAAERLLRDLWIYGTGSEAAALLEPWFDAGATSVAVTLPPNASMDLIHTTLEAFAPGT